jgi:hypothetical protein
VRIMKRLEETSDPLTWLVEARPSHEAVTGFDASGWQASTWVLHAMYENSALAGMGTHDDLHRRRLAAGDVAHLIIGEVNLDAVSTVSGTPLGFVIRPGHPWARVRWTEYLQRFPDFRPGRDVPSCSSWFPPGSWPVAIKPPPEGSLDGESFEALLSVLAAYSPQGQDTECFVFYASLPCGDFDRVHLWKGPLKHIPELIDDYGGLYGFSPTNFWPTGREWFVWTDYDLQGTKVSGHRTLVTALKAAPGLECIDWDPPANT